MSNKVINITEGSIPRQVVRLAWPAVGMMFLHTALSITDAIWVGRLGAEQMAAVVSSMFVLWILFSLIEIVAVGVVALISRAYGARDFEKVAHIGRQAVVLTAVGSVVVTLAGVLLADAVFDLMNTGAVVKEYGASYLRICFAITLLVAMNEVLSAVFRATGDTRTPLIVGSIAIVVNLVLDPLLIFGWGVVPRMEVAGAAIATAVSYLIGFLLVILMLRKGKLTFRFDWKKWIRPDGVIIRQMVKVGLPLSMAGIVFSLVYLFLNRITASFGTEAIAALGIGNRCESFSYLISWGFSIAVATLVGQNLGAGKPERAEKSVWYTIGISGFITFLIGLAFFLAPRQIASIFIADSAVQSMAVNYLLILALSQVFMAVEIVMQGAFSGAGNTMPPMLVSVVGSLVRIPLAYFLSYHTSLGIMGIWWTITITTCVKALILIIWFRRGHWKTGEVT